MPQTKSAAKSLRQTKRRTERNDKVRKNLDYLLRQFKKTLVNKNKTKTEEYAQKLIKSLDKAAKRNIIHKNKSARKKSEVMKEVNKLK